MDSKTVGFLGNEQDDVQKKIKEHQAAGFEALYPIVSADYRAAFTKGMDKKQVKACNEIALILYGLKGNQIPTGFDMMAGNYIDVIYERGGKALLEKDGG